MRKEEAIYTGGRIGVYLPEHPKANISGYILKSRHVVEQHIGRYLESYEEVHHKDGNKLNDSIDNLEVLTKADHARLHIDARNKLMGKEKLDYDVIRYYMSLGNGYKKIAKITSYKVGSVKMACRKINRDKLGA